MVSDLEGPLRRAVAQKFLLDPCSVEVAQEFVSPVLEFLELGVGHTIGYMCHDFRVQIAEADLAAVDDCWKILEKKLLPDLLVDPLDLKEMASHQLIQAILRSDLEELLLHTEVALLRRHLLDGLAVLILFHELEAVVGLDLHDVDEPVEGVGVAVHGDLDAFGLLHFGDHLREVRDGASIFL